MGGIERVASKRAARADDSHRRLHLLHGSNLHRRCMGSQQQVLGNIKRVPGVSRGMADWEVQRVEIVVGALDFRAVLNGVAERNENVFDFLPDDREGMTMSNAAPIAGQCNVKSSAC